MSSPGYVESLIGGLEATTKRALVEAFRYILPNTRFGPVEHQTKSENFQGYFLISTSAASTAEFSIEHGLGRIPYLVKPVLPMDLVGARVIPLTVTRAADAQRIYLKTDAGSTSAAFALYVE